MLISSRRLLWGFNVLLLLAAAVIFRPFRSWIDQTIIARAIHPDVRVQEIHLHAGKLDSGLSVIEAKQFDWSATHGSRSFGIMAQRAWVVVDNASLVEKKISIPKALLQQSKLYLESIPEKTAIARNTSTNATNPGSLWQQQLNSRFGDLEWNNLRQHFDGVLKLDSFASQCGSKIDNWVAETEKIAAEAQRLSGDKDLLQNPLRDGIDLQSRIGKLELLVARDKSLRAEMANIDSTVKSKLDQIGAEFETHSGLIKDKAKQAKNETSGAFASELLEQTGGRIISQFKAFAEVADLVCRATTRGNGISVNEDYRKAGLEVLNLNSLMATGVFAFEDSKSPFRMQSECMLTSKAPFGTMDRSSFRYQFDATPFTVKLVTSSRLEQPEMVDLQIEIVRLDKPAVDMTVQTQANIEMAAPQWIIASNGHSIVGELYIDRLLLPFMAEGNPALAASLNKQLEAAEKADQMVDGILLEIGGTWSSPTWKTANSAIPIWLESAIDQQLDQQIRSSEQQMVAKLEEHVGAAIDQLGNELQQRLDAAQKLTDLHTQSIATAHNTLKSKITQENNTEFARSPGPDEVNR